MTKHLPIYSLVFAMSFVFAPSGLLRPPKGAVAAVPAQTEATARSNAKRGKTTAGDKPMPAKPQPTFWQQAQQLYEQAKVSGTTTATSTADWVAELYDSAVTGTQSAAQSSTDWITHKYNEALEAGETRAKSSKDWVMEDLGKIGTWQYKVAVVMSTPQRVERELNQLGAERWECFAVREIEGERRTTLYLKRPHRSYLRYLPAKDLLRLAPLLTPGGDVAE